MFNFSIVFFNPFKPRINEVILSKDLLAAAARMIISTPSAAAWCSLYKPGPFFLLYWALAVATFFSLFPLCSPRPLPILLLVEICSVILFQISSTQSLLFSLSNMPSQPIMMKSKLSCTLKEVISGSHTITLGFPPYFGRLASMSPNVLLTERRPGKTRRGPCTYKSFSPGCVAALANVCVR